jgi:hypothetical protein
MQDPVLVLRSHGSRRYHCGDGITLLEDAHRSVVTIADLPVIATDSEKLEAMRALQTIAQKFIPPA